MRLGALILVTSLVVGPDATVAFAPQTFTGEVVEMSCPLVRDAASQGAAHDACALRCAREGATMGLRTSEGLYRIVGEYTVRKNARMLDFVARRVHAKGTASEKDGVKTLAVRSMAIAR